MSSVLGPARLPGVRARRDAVFLTDHQLTAPRVAPLSDEAAIGAEAEVEAELGSLARLGALLLSGASLSEEAAATLEAPALLLRRHAQRKAAGAYAEAAARVQSSEAALRRQSLSLAACELVQLPPQVAAAALATTSGAARLRLLLAQLRPIVAEMSALQALGALGDPRVAGEGLVSGVPGQPWKLRAAAAEAEAGAVAGAGAGAAGGAPSAPGRRRVVAGFQAVDIPLGDAAAGGAPRPAAPAAELPPGSRIEFWWNEEWGWCAATVRKQLRPGAAGGKLRHTLEFDGWGEEWFDECLEFDDGGRRWRPLGPRRDETRDDA